MANQNSILPDLRRTEWFRKEEKFSKPPDACSLLSVDVLSFAFTAQLITNDEHFTVYEKGGAVLREINVVCFLSSAKVLVLSFTSKSLRAQYRPGRFHVTVFKEYGPSCIYKREYSVLFVVYLLFA